MVLERGEEEEVDSVFNFLEGLEFRILKGNLVKKKKKGKFVISWKFFWWAHSQNGGHI